MTFNAYETSIAQGSPVFLFDFSAGLAHWRYCTADRPLTVASAVYSPIAIAMSPLVQSNEIKKRTITITVPIDATVVAALEVYPPSTDLLITVYEYHTTDPDVQTRAAFIGRVMSQNQQDAQLVLSCEPAYTGVQTIGLRRRWQINCPHVLYDAGGCNLSPVSFKRIGTLTTASGITIDSTAFVPPTGLAWPGGFVEWDSGRGYLERRSIDGASGTTLTLNYGSPSLVPGLSVTAYPGCRHNGADCNSFGNILNYGGELNIPTKNPMSGNPVY